MNSPENKYSSLLRQSTLEYSRYHKICRRLTWLRLAAFLSLIFFFYFALTRETKLPGFILSGVSLVILFLLVRINTAFIRKRNYMGTLMKLCEKELMALRYEFLEFPDGSEYIDNLHVFSSDIDMFGHGSAFQYIDRTVTYMGRSQLVRWLADPTLDKEEILARQESCRELSGLTEWRLRFAATGLETGVSDSPDNLMKWLKMSNIFRKHNRFLILIRAWQPVMALLAIAVIAGWANYNFLILAGFLNLSFVGVYLRQINQVSHFLGKTYTILDNYTGLFNKLHEANFHTPWIRQRIDLLFSENCNASGEIDQLRKLLQQFDSRNNLLVGFFRDALFLTDLLLVIKMELWRNRNADTIGNWLEALGQLDAMNSLSTFAFNNSSYAYPVPVTGDFTIQARNLGHPLIPSHERVCNDFSLQGWQTLVILTGANMAGKSTFLRTVGFNHILAHTGAPVCATEYRFLPAQLITSIRTNDSLIKHESYFYAELKKLKSIIEALEQGKEVFILLDEVLKGTNSNDKLNGSITLIRKLLLLKASGIIATHDIALGELEQEFPGHILNSCFEADISDGQLTFDYKLKQGTAKSMTALFLMKQMGIV